MSDLNPPTIKACPNVSDPISSTIDASAEVQDFIAPRPPTLTVEEICVAYEGRRAALESALLTNYEQFFRKCPHKNGNLSLLAFENGTWEVVPAGDGSATPAPVPNPINIYKRDNKTMTQRYWRKMVAMQCDKWLFEQAINSSTEKAHRAQVYNVIRHYPYLVTMLPIKRKRTNEGSEMLVEEDRWEEEEEEEFEDEEEEEEETESEGSSGFEIIYLVEC